MKHSTSLYMGLISMLLLGCRGSDKPRYFSPATVKEGMAGSADKPLAPLLEGLGQHHFAVATRDPAAQRYFDQGLVLAYGFNHAEAERAFREALRRDPACAMCLWGAALVLGPNINAPMARDNVPRAFGAIMEARALARASRVTARERALITALMRRYAKAPPQDRSQLDRDYADAMRAVARQFPGDADVLTLLGEALMDLHPWDFWKKDSRKMQPWTAEILQVLEAALVADPNHPGANHLYIHAVEASREPERGLASADRLTTLVPGAGHLVHMPAHIYIRVGRYADASAANERAIAADQAYLTQCHAQGLYPLGYYPHNYHFLFVTSAFEGRSQTSIDAARKTREQVPLDKIREPGLETLQHFHIMPLYAYTRFGRWEEILAEPEPAEDLIYPRVVWHYARGMALRARGRLKDAERELEALAALEETPALAKVTLWNLNTARTLANIAHHVLAGEIAARRKDDSAAIRHLSQARDIEATLAYNEPPDWFYPARHNLGAVLLEAGQPRAAEDVYRDDLIVYPENGWALFGLAASLKAQGRDKEAAAVQERFRKAWAHADVTLSASRW